MHTIVTIQPWGVWSKVQKVQIHTSNCHLCFDKNITVAMEHIAYVDEYTLASWALIVYFAHIMVFIISFMSCSVN